MTANFITNNFLLIKKKNFIDASKELVLAFFFMVVMYRIIFGKYSGLSQILLFSFFGIGIKGLLKNIFLANVLEQCLIFLNLLVTTTMLIGSVIIHKNEFSLVIRFFLLTNMIILSFFYPVNIKIVKIFIVIVLIQALFVIGFEVFMIMNFNLSNYAPVRLFINELGIGDVYSFDGKFWRIQLAGNHLIPLGLFISMVKYKKLKRIVLALVFLSASIFSGHFAFLIGIAFFICLFFIFKTKLNNKNFMTYLIIISFTLLLISKPAYDYITYTVERKADRSLSTRSDQIKVLMRDLSDSYLNLIFGKGYGNTVDVVTNSRDYRGKVYYELQTLYIFNQFGLIYSIFFLLLNLYLVFSRFKDKDVVLIFAAFLLYASTNPYLFDSVHIMIIVVLLSLSKYIKQES